MKKFFSVVLCLMFIFMCFQFNVSAQEEKTVFYLDKGNITISESSVTGYDANGTKITQVNPLGYVITQTNPSRVIDKGVTITTGNISIELKNINTKRKADYNSAVAITKTASVDITLTGENHLVSGASHAGIEIALTASATIGGDGVLYTQSSGTEAGIGGGSGHSNGSLTINSGTVYATGGAEGYGAAIGGGGAGGGGNITINGGFIYAVGSLYSAGIGGGDTGSGGNITINGGTVTAVGGKQAAGIGGGYQGNGGNVVINGGSVKAVAGSSAADIGNGYNCATAFSGVKNSAGDSVSVVSAEVQDYSAVYFNGIETGPITMGHPDDTNLYFYAGTKAAPVTAYMNDGSVGFCLAKNTGLDAVSPYINGDYRYEDMLITASEDIQVADGFSVANNILYYNGTGIDKFEQIRVGDANTDGGFDARDAIIAQCVVNSMLDDSLTVMLADADISGQVTDDDVLLLEQYGLMMVD